MQFNILIENALVSWLVGEASGPLKPNAGFIVFLALFSQSVFASHSGSFSAESPFASRPSHVSARLAADEQKPECGCNYASAPSQPWLDEARGDYEFWSLARNSARSQALHCPPQLGYNRLFEPGLPSHPDPASPTRMRKWEKLRAKF